MKGQKTGGRKVIVKDRICLGVYVSRENYERLIKHSEERECTLSDIVRQAIREYLNKGE